MMQIKIGGHMFKWMLGVLMCAFALHVAAQSFPNRPVKIIVPFAAGGGPDIDARRLAPRLSDALGAPVVVENRVGAAGILAAEVVTQSPADGYTVLAGSISQVVQKILRPQARFDPLTSFVPVGLTATSPAVLVVPVDSPVKTVKDLEALVRGKPGQINFGSGGIGTSAHIAGASFVNLLKLNAVHIPYRGSVELMPALIGGQIQFAFPIAGTGVPMVKSGKARALAVTSAKRISSLPDVPTMKELYGEDLFIQESWSGLWVPAGTPAGDVQKLHTALKQALGDPELRAYFAGAGSEVEVSASPEAFASFMKAETQKWAKIIQLTGVKAD
jgi:tripartite-type tricarboxylate transporter receptor subunit TctC